MRGCVRSGVASVRVMWRRTVCLASVHASALTAEAARHHEQNGDGRNDTDEHCWCWATVAEIIAGQNSAVLVATAAQINKIAVVYGTHVWCVTVGAVVLAIGEAIKYIGATVLTAFVAVCKIRVNVGVL